jgi:O-antigen/teichoic acid export membrane protein
VSADRVTRSQILLVSAHAARLALFVAVASLLGRKLDPADFGFVALVSSLYFVAAEILDLGTTAVATRQVAAAPERERVVLSALLALRRLVAIVLFGGVLALAFGPFVPLASQRLVLVAAAVGVYCMHLTAYYPAFQLRQAYGRPIALGLTSQVGFLLASAVTLALNAGGAVIGLLVVVRELAHVLSGRWAAVRLLGTRLRTHWSDPGMWPLLHAAWMIGVAGLCYKLAAYAGGFMLWALIGPQALASFNAAQRLLVPIADMTWWFVTPLVAAMSVAVVRSPAGFRMQLESYGKLLLAMSCLLAVGVYFTAPLVLQMLYGEVYASGQWSAVQTLRWLALACVFALVTPVLIVGEIAKGNARVLLSIASACLALNVAGNTWIIPAHGAAGAAVMWCVSEAFVFVVLLARSAAQREVRLDSGWVAYVAPAALLALALSLLEFAPVLQLAVACGWAPAAFLAILRLPAQKARRAGLGTAQWHPQVG